MYAVTALHANWYSPDISPVVIQPESMLSLESNGFSRNEKILIVLPLH